MYIGEMLNLTLIGDTIRSKISQISHRKLFHSIKYQVQIAILYITKIKPITRKNKNDAFFHDFYCFFDSESFSRIPYVCLFANYKLTMHQKSYAWITHFVLTTTSVCNVIRFWTSILHHRLYRLAWCGGLNMFRLYIYVTLCYQSIVCYSQNE